MAKLKDIENESTFAPVHKDPERRAISLGLLISLPSLLGIVKGQGNFIKRGAWQSLEQELGDTFHTINDELSRNPATRAASGSKARAALLENINKIVKADGERNYMSEITSVVASKKQIADDAVLVKYILTDASIASKHFGAKLDPSMLVGEYDQMDPIMRLMGESNPAFGIMPETRTRYELDTLSGLFKSRQEKYKAFRGAFYNWWDVQGKHEVYDLVSTNKNADELVKHIKNSIWKQLSPKKGVDPSNPFSPMQITAEGIELGRIQFPSPLSYAASDMHDATSRIKNFFAKYSWTPAQVHKRILELALQRTKISSLSSGGIGPWDTPTHLDSVDQKEFLHYLENDEVFREKFYDNVKFLYNKSKGRSIFLPADLKPQEDPWKIASIFNKDGSFNAAQLDYIQSEELGVPRANNYNFTNDSLDALTKSLEDRRTGLTSLQQSNLVGGQGHKTRLDALHETLYNPVGHGSAEAIFGERAKAEALIEVRDAFKNEIQVLKDHVNSLVNNPGKAAKVELKELAKLSGMSEGQFVAFIKGMEVKAEISAQLYGGSSFKTANIIITRKGYSDIKLGVSLTEKGAFVPNSGAKVHSSPLFLPSLTKGTAQNIQTIDIAMLKKMVLNANHYVRDLVQGGFLDPSKVYDLHKSFWGTFMDKVHPEVTGQTQNIVRRSKLIVEDLQILRGEASNRWYKKFAAGYEALSDITNIAKTHSTILTLDFEFNAKNTLGYDSTMNMVRNAHTRPYWGSYIITKGGKRQIMNHWINPSNWLDIKDNVKKFMLEQYHEGGIQKYWEIEAIMNGADRFGVSNSGRGFAEFAIGQDREGNWHSFTRKEFEQKTIPKKYSSIRMVKVHSELDSYLSIARSIFGSTDSGVKFLTHGGEEADLVLWNKRANKLLDQINRGIIKNIDESDVKLLEKLAEETSESKLLARGRSLDTHSMATVVLADQKSNTRLGLTDIYTKLMTMEVSSTMSTKDDVDNAMKALGNSISTQGRTVITGKMNNILMKFPEVVRGHIKRWILENPQDAKALLSEGLSGHHMADFDTQITDLNRILLSSRFERMKRENPMHFNRLEMIYKVAKNRLTGRQMSHFHTMDLVRDFPMFQVDDMLSDDELRLSLYSGSPNQASKAMGHLLRIEQFLPFGHLANLQKQYYQVLSQRVLPDLGYIADENLNYMTAKPILGHRLFTTSQQAAMEHAQEEVMSARFGAKHSTRTVRPMQVLYMPGNNSIVGEDSALYANKKAMLNNMNFFRGPIEKVTLNHRFSSNLLRPENLVKDKRTLLEFFDQLGLSDRVKAIIQQSGHGDMLLSDFIKYHGGEGGVPLDLFDPQRIVKDATEEYLNNKRTNPILKIGSGDSFFDKVSSANLETDDKKRLSRVINSMVKNPINGEVIIKAIEYDTDSNQFIFDLTAVHTPTISKLSSQLKKMKVMSLGTVGNTSVGKGIDLVAGMKKPDAAQLLDIQLRRVLADLYREQLPFEEQKKRLETILMKAFNLDKAELNQVFKINRSPLLHEKQVGLFGKGVKDLATIELLDATMAKIDSNSAMGNILGLLEEQGLTTNKMKKIFTEQHADLISKTYTGVSLEQAEVELGKLYDNIVDLHKKELNKWINSQANLNLSGELGTKKLESIHKLREIMRKGLSFYDAALLPNKSSLVTRIKEATSKGLAPLQILKEDFDQIGSGKIIDTIVLAHSSFLVTDEASIMEDLTNVSTYKGLLKDFYNNPTKGSSTLWETLIRMESLRGNELAAKKFLPELIQSFGWFNANIRSSLETHSKVLEVIKDGYKLEDGYISSKNVYNVKYLYKSTNPKKKYMHANDVLRQDANAWTAMRTTQDDIMDKLPGTAGKSTYAGLSDDLIIKYLKAERGEEYISSKEFLSNKREILDEVKSRFMAAEVLGRNSITKEGLDRIHIFNFAGEHLAGKQYISFDIPDFMKMLEENRYLKGLSPLLRSNDLIMNDKSLFFSKLRDTLAKETSNRFEEGLLKRLDWLYAEQEGRLSQIIFPHLEHEGPKLIDNQYLFAEESAAKMRTIAHISSYGYKLEKAVDDLHGALKNMPRKEDGSYDLENMSKDQKKLINRTIKDIRNEQENFFSNLAKQQVEVFSGLSKAAWKSQRAYAPILYGKAVDVAMIVEQGLGGIFSDIKGGKGNLLRTKIFSEDNAIVKALKSNAVQNALTESGESVLNRNINNTEASKIINNSIQGVFNKNITYGELFSEILGVPYTRESEKGALINKLSTYRSIEGKSRYAVKGMAIGEGVMSHSMFGELLKGGNKGVLKVVANKDVFREVLAGKKAVTELFARAPLFENYFGARLRNVYLMPDEVFERMNIDPNETKRIVAVSAFDMMLHGGDFDGDLANFMLNKTNMYTKEYLGKAELWRDGVSDQQRVKDWINLRIQQEGKGSMGILGRNYLGVEEVDGRFLIRTDTGRMIDMQNEFGNTMKYMDDPVEKMSMPERQRMYMLQQALTPIFGQKAKIMHTMYLGEDPAVKTEIIDAISSKLDTKGLQAIKTTHELGDLLVEVGALTKDEASEMVEGGRRVDLQKAANKYVNDLNSAWDWMQGDSKIPLWDFEFDEAGQVKRKTRGTMNRTRFGVFYDWFNRALIHGVPIEKAKSGSLNDFYNITAQFSKLTSGVAGEADAKAVHDYFWKTNPMKATRLSDWFAGQDTPLSQSEVMEIERLAKEETLQTMQSFMRLQRASRGVTTGTSFGSNPYAAYWTLSDSPKNAVFGAQVDLLSNEKSFVHSYLTNALISPEQKAMITDADSAAFFMIDSLENELTTKRTTVESVTKYVKDLMSETGKKGLNTWGKRAAIGALAAIVLDPNTNSILLPELEADGEKYDIPSFDEISKSYKNRFTKLRGRSAPLIDKLMEEMSLPYRIGGRSVNGPKLPPNPNRIISNKRDYRNNTLNIREYARQVNGIMLGQ